MHSMVRANIMRSGKWDVGVYGIPIPQVDQMPAGLIGTYGMFMLAGIPMRWLLAVAAFCWVVSNLLVGSLGGTLARTMRAAAASGLELGCSTTFPSSFGNLISARNLRC